MNRTFAFIGLFACEESTGGEDTDSPCANAIETIDPADGLQDAFYRTNVVYTLAQPDPSATVSVVGPTGPIPGATTVDGAQVTWHGDVAFEPNTTYSPTLTWTSCPAVATTFTTTPVAP